MEMTVVDGEQFAQRLPSHSYNSVAGLGKWRVAAFGEKIDACKFYRALRACGNDAKKPQLIGKNWHVNWVNGDPVKIDRWTAPAW
jgi:hypothetical protein